MFKKRQGLERGNLVIFVKVADDMRTEGTVLGCRGLGWELVMVVRVYTEITSLLAIFSGRIAAYVQVDGPCARWNTAHVGCVRGAHCLSWPG